MPSQRGRFQLFESLLIDQHISRPIDRVTASRPLAALYRSRRAGMRQSGRIRLRHPTHPTGHALFANYDVLLTDSQGYRDAREQLGPHTRRWRRWPMSRVPFHVKHVPQERLPHPVGRSANARVALVSGLPRQLGAVQIPRHRRKPEGAWNEPGYWWEEPGARSHML